MYLTVSFRIASTDSILFARGSISTVAQWISRQLNVKLCNYHLESFYLFVLFFDGKAQDLINHIKICYFS